VLEDIKNRLFHTEIPNTAYHGVINDETLLRDMALAKGNKILNQIFSFMFFVNSGDFTFDDIAPFYISRSRSLLPNVSVLLDQGVIICGTMRDDRFVFHRYPEQYQDMNSDWFFSPLPGKENGSTEGNHLGYLYYSILEHLSNSYLEPSSFGNFIDKLRGQKSLLRKAKTVVNAN